MYILLIQNPLLWVNCMGNLMNKLMNGLMEYWHIELENVVETKV